MHAICQPYMKKIIPTFINFLSTIKAGSMNGEVQNMELQLCMPAILWLVLVYLVVGVYLLVIVPMYGYMPKNFIQYTMSM